MNSARRYAELLPVRRVREELIVVPPRRPELELQAHWFAGNFGRSFRTTDGRQVEIIQFGVWNREAGADFAEAAVSFDGAEPVRGSIELDPDVRDWERHGHATNPDYDPVILHLFVENSAERFFTRTIGNRNVPQVQLDPGRLATAAPNPQPVAKPGRCSAVLRDLPLAHVREIIEAAAQFRFHRKVERFAALTAAHGFDEALYQSLAASLGYKNNKLPLTVLAQRLPVRMLLKMRREIDAILFGVSGFVEEPDLGRFHGEARAYVRALWETWWARRAEFQTLILPRREWNLGGTRPANHPQRRIAALAQIVRHWSKIPPLARRCDARELRRFFTALDDPFWSKHFTLTSTSVAAPMALVGETRLADMLINIFLPAAAAAGKSIWESYRELPAPMPNRRAEIAATRLFGNSPARAPLTRRAIHQQGLLQIYEDFCMQDATGCAACSFPERASRWCD